MNGKIIDTIFTFLIFALPFKYISQILWQDTLGGPFGKDLVVYPIIIGFIYTGYCQWKDTNTLYKWNIFKKYILAYVTVLLLSLIWGLVIYPYYDQILMGPANQIEKLPRTLNILQNIGIPITETTLLEIWMFVRPIKGVFFEALYTFGAAYMIFCWYHDRVQRAVDILLKVTTIDLVLIAVYGLIDVCYQNGQMWAQNALTILNPIIHANASLEPSSLEFRPAIFRDAQNRSLFLEPSYFGMYMVFAYPLLWWNIFRTQSKKKKTALWILFVVITFEIFLTQSRLALAVNLGIFFIFAMICLYRTQKDLLALLGILLIGGGIAFWGSMAFLRYGQVPTVMGDWKPLATRWEMMHQNGILEKGTKDINADEYFSEGLGSLSPDYKTGNHAGSNHSRFTLQKTHVQIGLEHPLLGIGTSMRQGYLREKLDNDSGGEIQKWNKIIDKRGILYGGFPNLGDFALRFAETGLLGISLYLFPALLLLWSCIKVIIKRKMNTEKTAPFIFSALSFVGIMSTGLGDGINLTFCYWIAMAVGYIIINEEGIETKL